MKRKKGLYNGGSKIAKVLEKVKNFPEKVIDKTVDALHRESDMKNCFEEKKALVLINR